MFGADALSGAAAGAPQLVDHRESFGPHGDGVEGADPGTRAQSEAADGAHLHPAAHQTRGAAVAQAVVNELRVGLGNAVSTTRPGDVGFFGFHRYADNTGDYIGKFSRCGNT